MSEVEDALKIFGSIHDLITSHDDGLRASQEVYKHVRKCFDMLYDYIGEGEKKETRGNARCKLCCHQGLGHDEKGERPRGGGQRSKERGQEFLPQTVLICQPTDTRLRGDDRDLLGTVTLTATLSFSSGSFACTDIFLLTLSLIHISEPTRPY